MNALSQSLPQDHPVRVERARRSLNGVSLGDAFGERFFQFPEGLMASIEARQMPPPLWTYTDDTVMTLSVFEILELHGTIDQDALARGFAAKYVADPNRGYGPGAHRLLRRLASGEDWRTAAAEAFGGAGSYGNGAAMRAAPIGAYFADDLERVVAEARRSAQITHSHLEGIAGAIAVAVAAGCAANLEMTSEHLVENVLQHTPAGETRRGIAASRKIDFCGLPIEAAGLLGSGALVSSQDTVPFVIWCVARHLHDDFEEAMWNTIAGLGDLDTTCAMVGGILSLRNEGRPLPARWIEAREPLSKLARLGISA